MAIQIQKLLFFRMSSAGLALEILVDLLFNVVMVVIKAQTVS